EIEPADLLGLDDARPQPLLDLLRFSRHANLSSARRSSGLQMMIWDRGSLLRAGAHRGRMTRQFDALPRIGQGGSVNLQDRQIRVDKIADIEVLPVGAEGSAFGKSADIDLACIGDLLAVDPERGDRTRR